MNAAKLLDLFEVKTRKNGEEYYALRDDAPDEVRELVRECHLDMLPNDTSYNIIVSCLEAMADGYEVEVPQNIHALINWMASHPFRIAFIDDARRECGDNEGIETIIRNGWYHEAEQVRGALRRFIQRGEES